MQESFIVRHAEILTTAFSPSLAEHHTQCAAMLGVQAANGGLELPIAVSVCRNKRKMERKKEKCPLKGFRDEVVIFALTSAAKLPDFDIWARPNKMTFPH